MRGPLADPRTRRTLVGVLILLGGLAAAAVIYARAAASTPTLPELSPETSKKYLRDLQMYGGTANVLAVELETWFEHLWHGRPLAYTVAVLSLVASLAYLFFTVVLPPYRGPDSADDGSRGGGAPGSRPPSAPPVGRS